MCPFRSVCSDEIRPPSPTVPRRPTAQTGVVFFTYGFALQERSLSFEMPDEIADEPRRCSLASPPANMSTSPEAMVEHVGKPGYDYGDEFGFGIDLILEAL